MKRILLISYNFSPELTGIGKYNGEMINWLAKAGYECSVLTSYPYYPFWKVQEPYRRRRFSYSYEEITVPNTQAKVRVYRCPMFVPARPTGTKRILLDLSFFISSLFRLVTLIPRQRFDFIMAVAPSFQVGLLGVLYKKIRGAKLLYHIQDLQIEAARDLEMIKSKLLINTLLKTEKKIMDQADIVSTVSSEMLRKVEKKSARRVVLFPNWTNTRQFFPLKRRTSLKRFFGFAEYHKVVLYSGSMGEKQGLEAILASAEANLGNPDLQFVICGSGPCREDLVKTALERNLHNVHFLPLQPLEHFNAFLNMADVHLVVQKSAAGDLVMPSKLGAILAVGGVALITANPGTSLHALVKDNNMGLLVNAEDQRAFDHGIERLVSGDFREFGRNARRFALNYLSINQVMSDYESDIRKLFSEKVRVDSGMKAGELSTGNVTSKASYAGINH